MFWNRLPMTEVVRCSATVLFRRPLRSRLRASSMDFANSEAGRTCGASRSEGGSAGDNRLSSSMRRFHSPAGFRCAHLASSAESTNAAFAATFLTVRATAIVRHGCRNSAVLVGIFPATHSTINMYRTRVAKEPLLCEIPASRPH
jgi:hypothetical protein